MDFLLVAIGIVPAVIGLALREWYALIVVFALWFALLLFWIVGSGLNYDEVSGADFIALVAVLILLPAEAVAALAVVVGRWFEGMRAARSRGHARP
jgi:hypothetical protein